MDNTFSVVVEGGRPWGFTLQGGLEFRAPIRVGKVTPGGKAEKAGLISGDYITSINNTDIKGLKHLDAKRLIIESPLTLQLLCSKAAPVGIFSPPGSKPAPQFSFNSSTSPSHPITGGTRPRTSSFTSPTSPSPSHLSTLGTRSRTSSFTSPTSTRSRASSFTFLTYSPNPSPSRVGSSEKSLSLKRPMPPAVPVAPVAMAMGWKRGGKSSTLPNGRPKPPVTYQGDIANSSSGVSSSVSSAASSPPPHSEGGSLQYSPSHIHHPPLPPPSLHSSQHVSHGNTAAATDDTVNMTAATDDTVNTAAATDDTVNTAAATDDTVNTAAATNDTVNTGTDSTVAVDSDDIIPIMTASSDKIIPDSSDSTNTVSDLIDTSNTPTDTVDTANMIVDHTDSATDTVETTNTTSDPANTASTIADKVDTAQPTTELVAMTTDPIDTTNTVIDSADTTDPAADLVMVVDNMQQAPVAEVKEVGGKREEEREEEEREEEGEEGEEEGEGEGEEREEETEGGKKEKPAEEQVSTEEGEGDGGKGPGVESSQSQTVGSDEQRSEVTAPAPPPEEKPKTSIDKQMEDARRAREAEMKARAQSLLTGKLGSLVRSKPPLPPTASVAKPPVSPGGPVNKSPRSPQHVPRSPTGPLGDTKRRVIPVIKPHLVKKGEEKPNPQPSLPDRTMSDIKMAHRMPGWYKEMFQGFQQTVEELFPDSNMGSKDIQHARTKSSPADVQTYVYDHRGLKVKKLSVSDSSPTSPVITRPRSARTSTTDNPDPVYVYDHRGLRVRKDSLPSSETTEQETTPTINVLSTQEKVSTADVLAASRRQYSMDSGYDERGLRLRADSQGNGDTDHEEATSLTGEETNGVEVTKDDVIDEIKKPTAYKSDKFSTEPSRNYWTAVDQQFAEDQRRKREAEEQQEEARVHRRANSCSSEQGSPHHRMAHMHPLLTEGLEDVPTSTPGEVFDRIDAQKLHGALENAKTLGTMEQEGVPSSMLPLQAQQRETSKEPEKLPPPGKKARALFAFEGQREKELSFEKGAVIDLLHTINENWLEGMVGQRKGIFPSSYVQVLSHEELREALARENAPLMQVRAVYDFDPQNERELQFNKGDIIVITRKIDDNWYQGYLGDRKGIFPSSYVEVLED